MKIVYIIIGLISLCLGFLGAILPLLPAFPFLLLSAFCFGKSSPKLDCWFKQTKLYKNNLESFILGQGMTIAAKKRILCLISALMLFGFLMMSNVPVGRIILVIVWVLHLWIFMYKIETRVD